MNTKNNYGGESPPCDGCRSRRNCKTGMACDLYRSWVSVGYRAVGQQIPTRQIFANIGASAHSTGYSA